MTKSQIFFTILLGVLVQYSNTFAHSRPENCKRAVTHRSNLQFSQMYQKHLGECWFQVHPMNGYDTMVYRSYTVTSNGQFFVFNSYGKGFGSKMSGAREYYFFPRDVYTNGIQLQEDVVSVRVNAKLTLQFETENLYPLNGPNVIFRNLTSVNPKNAGGVEVLRYNGVYLDTGFVLGRAPSTFKNNKSMFKNQFGEKCSVQNQVLFDYKDGNPILLDDEQLHQIVSAACPNFKWID